MKRYLCRFLYKYKEEEVPVLLSMALQILGFEPKYMNIFFDEFEKPLDDIVFDEEYLFSLLKRKPGVITLKSKLYDENKMEDYFWFRFKIDIGTVHGLDKVGLEWSKNNLDFLMNNDSFNSFFEFENLIYCYCYNQTDCMDQSSNRIDSFLLKHPDELYKITKDHLGDDVIDISEHWGRHVNTRGMLFIAAPLMWFGDKFYKIIPKEELLKFKYSSIIKQLSFDMVYINLFDLYADPSKEENRSKQKEFWKFFDLQNKIDHYEKENSIDFVKWMQERAVKKQKKKR